MVDLQRIVGALCNNLIGLEAELNRLDAGSGDGDCGSTMAYGAKGSMKHDKQESSYKMIFINSCPRCPGLLYLGLTLTVFGRAWKSARQNGRYVGWDLFPLPHSCKCSIPGQSGPLMKSIQCIDNSSPLCNRIPPNVGTTRLGFRLLVWAARQ